MLVNVTGAISFQQGGNTSRSLTRDPKKREKLAGGRKCGSQETEGQIWGMHKTLNKLKTPEGRPLTGEGEAEVARGCCVSQGRGQLQDKKDLRMPSTAGTIFPCM